MNDFDKKMRAEMAEPMSVACHCRGPQNGEPLCPCQMRGVKVLNGRYVRVTDLGPAPGPPKPLIAGSWE